jgi:hypothetical protein
MKIKPELLQLKKATLETMRLDRLPWWQLWRELADYYLPNRYQWLLSPSEANQRATNRNSKILDNTGTKAARTLAAGMMNGITSPARPWFKLRLVGMEEEIGSPVAVWLDEVERRMLKVFSESNFYQSLATLYLDLVIFGTGANLIYESDEKVIHCTNPCLGEYFLMINAKHQVCGMAREFTYTVYQIVEEFGEENCPDTIKQAWKAGGARLQEKHAVIHFLEPNLDNKTTLSREFKYREYYWLQAGPADEVLRERGWYDFPGIAVRWELAGNDAYGTSPAMDSLGDVIQLQHETMKKAQGLDKMNDPPILADIQLEHKALSLLPRGITFVSRLSETSGARPIYTVNPPIQELTQDLLAIQQRIQQTFHNDLFNRVLNLNTVRSAREIDAIDSERLVLLGPVLQRFENEALDPAIERTFGIMMRNGLLPEPPAELQEADLKIQYVSIFAAAQNAVTTAPTERLLGLIGNLAEAFPEARLIPNVPELLLDYAQDIGVKSKGLRSLKDIQAAIAKQNQQGEVQQGMDQLTQGAAGAKLLSETDVGGGANALQQVLGR